IENDRKRRAYLSLLASNVALSYRKDNQPFAAQNPAPNASAGTQPQLSASPIETPYGMFVPFGAQTAAESSRSGQGNHEAETEGTNSDEHSEARAGQKGTRDRFADLN